jgi:hypothetical protein
VITHLQVAQACADLYKAQSPDQVAGIAYSISKVGDVSLVVARGSQTRADWLRDFDAKPAWTPLGYLHNGFWTGMPEFYAKVRSIVGAGPVMIGGHSLAGAEARILAGQFILDGLRPLDLVTFASPRPGYANLRRVIEKSGITHTNYRFRNDPVPLVPVPVPWVMPWEHTEPWTELDGPTDPAALDPLRDHNIDNYIRALTPARQALAA